MKSLFCLIWATIGVTSIAGAAVTLNQIETFSGTHGWISGSLSNPNPPVVVANSGPLGAGDSALLITGNGGGSAGGRLVAFNQSVWTGDYVGQSIVSIAANLRNPGSTDLLIRLVFTGPGGSFATAAAPVAAFSAWADFHFDIRPESLVSAGGGNAATTMAGVTDVRILHSPTPLFVPDPFAGSLLVDNIQAVPEPGSIMITSLAGALLLVRKRATPSA